jgi:hypothetical protein
VYVRNVLGKNCIGETVFFGGGGECFLHDTAKIAKLMIYIPMLAYMWKMRLSADSPFLKNSTNVFARRLIGKMSNSDQPEVTLFCNLVLKLIVTSLECYSV